MRAWITSVTANRYYQPVKVVLKVLYYYAILMALFYIYVVHKHTPPPFIYNGF